MTANDSRAQVILDNLALEGYSQECCEALRGFYEWNASGKFDSEFTRLCGVPKGKNALLIAIMRFAEELITQKEEKRNEAD